MSPATKKRSYKRALRRAMRLGQCRYRGKVLTRQQVLHMGYSPEDFPSARHSQTIVSSKRSSGRPGEQARAPRLKVFSWNCGGLSGDVYDNLLVSLAEDKIDVAFVQETRWGFTSEWETEWFYCFQSGLPNNSTKKSGEAGGVLTLVRKELASRTALRWCAHVPGRIMQVRLPYGKQHVDLINVYQKFCPHFWESSLQAETYHATWLALDNVLSALPCRNVLLIGGDLNAKLSPCGPHVGHAVGQSSSTYVDTDLMALVQKHNLCMLNSWSSPSAYTSVGPRGGRATVDYLATRLPQADSRSKQVMHLHQHVLVLGRVGYHVPLVTSVSLHWQCWKHRPVTLSRSSFDKIGFWRDASCNHPRFQAFMADASSQLASSDLGQLEALLHQVGCKHYPASGSQVCVHHPELVQCVRHRWQILRDLQCLRGLRMRTFFRGWVLVACLHRLQRRHRAKRQRIRRQKVEAAIEEAKEAVRTGNQRALHALIRKMSPKQVHERMQLRGDRGQLLSPSEEQSQIRSYMMDQYVTPGATIPGLRVCHQLPFSLNDLRYMLRTLPTFKAVPKHCAASVLVKYCSEILAPILYGLMDESWSQAIAHIPEEWCTSWLCWLAKPGKPHHTMKGWRGISLQSVIGKATLKAIVSHAKMLCFPRLSQFPQFAYLRGRSTGDAILRVMGHRARAIALGKSVNATHHDMRAGKQRGSLAGGLQFFMDIDGAFDRVARHTLLNALLFLDVPSDLISLLVNWHHHTPYIYTHNGSNIEVDANTGVRQGCVAAPLLWTAFTHVVMFMLGIVLTEEWLIKHLTLFADDLHASWEFSNEQELEMALVQLRVLIDMLLIIGIRVNMEKSVVQVHLRGTKAQTWKDKIFRQVNGKRHLRLKATSNEGSILLLPVVKEHKYLGVLMSYGNAMDRTLGLRIQAANHAFIRLRTWWKPSLPLKARMDLWFQVIWPTLTYGLFDVGLTKRGLARFQTVVYRQWRVIGRSPVHITRENNATLLERLAVVDPLVKLSIATLRLWQRRLGALQSLLPTDILHNVHSLCDTFRESDSESHHWYVWCVEQWDRAQSLRATSSSKVDLLCKPLDSDIEKVARQLGVTAQQRRQRWCTHDPDVTGSACHEPLLSLPPSLPLACPHCDRSFPHQMSLRQHIRHQHADLVLERIVFDLVRDSHDGMPTCRYCGMRFRYWLGLRQHIETRVCENLRNNTAVFGRSIPVCENPLFINELGQGAWEDVLSKASFKELTKQHCVFCHQWFPRAAALGYHLQHSHGEHYTNGQLWCKEKFRNKILIRITPCEWCGRCLANSSLSQPSVPSHCPAWRSTFLLQ